LGTEQERKKGLSLLKLDRACDGACDRVYNSTEEEGQREWVENSGGKEIGKKDERKETTETVPSQAEIEERGLCSITDKGKETLANLEGNPETAKLL
jgi:hypothetical protein